MDQTEVIETKPLADGIYFDIEEKDYHAIARLSSSGMQSILVSPGTFWADSWMNPGKEDRDNDTDARILGRAYHAARFEPEEFEKKFCRDLAMEDIPDVLTNDTMIKEQLEKIGQPKTKAGENVLDRAERLKAMGYGGPIWHLERAKFEESLDGRTPIKGKYYDQILQDMGRIKCNPEIAEHFEGGCAEVTVLYTDPDSGIAMKCRLDYLKPKSFTDLKTFENTQRKNLDQCITDAFRYNRYYIQAASYWQVTELIRTGQVIVAPGRATAKQAALIEAIRAQPHPLRCWYVFQEKKGVPNLLAYEFRIFQTHPSARANEIGASEEGVERARAGMTDHTMIYRKAAAEIQLAQIAYLNCKEAFGDDEWFVLNPVREISDDSFSLYWLEGR